MRSPWRIALAVLVGGAALVVDGQPVSACSCMELAFEDYVDDISIAFVGRQVERRVEDEIAEDGTALVFEVSEVYLGEVTDPFEVRTAAHEATCGIDLAGRGEVAIAARTYRGEPLVGLCGSVVTRADLQAAFGDPTTPAPAPPEDDGGSEWPARLGLGALLLAVVSGAGVWIAIRRNAG